MITKPGIYADVPIAAYVADPCLTPSLSASIADILISRSPAHAYVAHPRFTPVSQAEWSAAANFGSAVHSLVFGGQKVQRYGYADWRKKEAKEDRENCLAVGDIPLLLEEWERAQMIAKIAREVVSTVFAGQGADFEQTIAWQSGPTWLRVRPDAISNGRRTIFDLKITGTDVAQANRQFFSQGYDMQAAFLERGADAIDPAAAGRRTILYGFIEDEPPFATKILRVSESTLQIARKKMNAAINLWTECLREKRWPAYSLDQWEPTEMPGWQEQAWLSRELAGSVNVEIDE